MPVSYCAVCKTMNDIKEFVAAGEAWEAGGKIGREWGGGRADLGNKTQIMYFSRISFLFSKLR